MVATRGSRFVKEINGLLMKYAFLSLQDFIND